MEPIYTGEELLYENNFIDPVELEDLKPEEQELFVKFYKKKLEQEKIKSYTETNSNKSNDKNEVVRAKRITIPKREIVIIDSSFRNTKLYPYPNEFEYTFEQGFNNVQSIRLIKSVFPNTDSVIKDMPAELRNNRIYWINQEDYDLNFPVYSVALRPGSYTALSLQQEIVSKMNFVKRREGTGSFHDFTVDLDLDTDIVSFTCLAKTRLGINPISVSEASGIITVAHTGHNFTTGQLVYFSGIKTISGISIETLNNPYPITVIDSNTYTYEVNEYALQTVTGGGSAVFVGIQAPFKFLWGEYTDNVSFNLGFPKQNSSFLIPNTNPISTVVLSVDNIDIGTSTILTVPNHPFSVGQKVKVSGITTIPDLSSITSTITSITTNTITLNTSTSYISPNFNNVKVLSNLLNLNFSGHGFNTIQAVENWGAGTIKITTQLPHLFTFNSSVYIKNTNSNPITDGFYLVQSVISSTEFVVNFSGGMLITPSDKGYIGTNQEFYLYDTEPVNNGLIGGIDVNVNINEQKQIIYKIVDENNILFETNQVCNSLESGGGSAVRISSWNHGFRGEQTNQNTETTLVRPISLEGVNYVYLCSPEMEGTIRNNTNVKDAFAVILLSQPPGSVIFNSFIENPKTYSEGPLPVLNKMKFIVRNPDGTLFDFNNMNYSFGLEIIQMTESFENTRINTQAGLSYLNNFNYINNANTNNTNWIRDQAGMNPSLDGK